MAGFKPSPGDAAKSLAARQAELQGDLTVVGLTPGGRGGWMTKPKRTQFWLDHGAVYLHRHIRSDHLVPFRYGQNGPCAVCGSYDKAASRVDGFAPDPAPGTRIAGLFGSFAGTPRFASDFAYVTACPDCVARLGLLAKTHSETHRSEYAYDEAKQLRGVASYQDARPHPGLWKYVPLQYTADIRKVQRGEFALEAVAFQVGEPEPRWWEVAMTTVAQELS